MTFSPQDLDRIRAAAADAMKRASAPGLSVAVVTREGVAFAEPFGFSDIEAAQAMTLDRRQCIASISKTMVGLCAMALVSGGKLALDRRVGDLLPDVTFHGPAETMTVWHLLTHTAGIGEAQTQEMLANTVNPDQDARRAPGDFASMYGDGCVTEFVPGTKWHYANHGYNLLGEIVRRVEGAADLNDVLQRRVFGPLGMKDSDLLGDDHPDLSTPYHRTPSDDAREQLTRAGVVLKDQPTVDGVNIRGKFGGEFNRAALASGGVQSTLADMSRYALALLRHADGILPRATFDEMIAPHHGPDPRLTQWGLSFSRTPFHGRSLIGHGGAYFGGWNSHLDVSLDDGVAIVQQMNVMMDDPMKVFRPVARAVFGVEPPVHPPRATDASILVSAPGTYELTPGRLTNFRPATTIGRIRIERDGDALTLTSRWGKWKRGVALTPADDADPAFFAIQQEDDDAPAYIALTRDGDGGVDGLRCDRLVHMVRKQ